MLKRCAPLTWDEESRLTNIAYPSGALSTYVYSADGLRRKREETGVSLLEVWDGTQLLQEKDSTTKAEVTRYLLQNHSYSGLRAQRQASDGIWRYFAYDVQGSTRKLLNSDGTSNLDLLYRAFGQKQASSGAGQTLMQFGAFYGYEWDADSRMWVKARHLSGTQGRWLSQDPIGFDGGDWNLFRYVGNNPAIWVDPQGQWVWIAVGTVVGGVIGYWGNGWPGAVAGALGGLIGSSIGNPYLASIIANTVQSIILDLLKLYSGCKVTAATFFEDLLKAVVSAFVGGKAGTVIKGLFEGPAAQVLISAVSNAIFTYGSNFGDLIGVGADCSCAKGPLWHGY